MSEVESLELSYRPPYDWPAIRQFLHARAIAGVEMVAENHYARTFDIAGAHGIVIIEPRAEGVLEATIHGSRTSALPEVSARLRRVFDLDADPLRIGAHLGSDPLLAGLVAARPGLRVPGAWDAFELAVRAVLGQQITVTAARGLAGRFVAHYGQRFAAATATDVGGLTHVFPSAGQVAGADLSSLGVPRARAEALGRLAAIAASEPDLLDSHPDTAETVTRLRAIRGVGQWTADYIAMRALRDPDAFPAGDVGLQRALAAETGRRATLREALVRAERWRPWRAYAAQHLWTALARRADSSSI